MALNIETEVIHSTSSRKNRVKFSKYVPALAVALFKDILDLVLIGSLPGIGTVVTLIFSMLIFMLLMLSGSSHKYPMQKKGVMLLLGTLTESFFFGLNFLPIETLTVLAIYWSDKKQNS